MIVLSLALLIVAIILFVIAGIGVNAGRFSLIAFGLAFWATSQLLPLLAST